MTDPSANRKIHLALGIQSGLETADYSLGFTSGKQDRLSCCPRDQSLFVYNINVLACSYAEL